MDKKEKIIIKEEISDYVKSLKTTENIVGEFTDTKQMIKTLLEED